MVVDSYIGFLDYWFASFLSAGAMSPCHCDLAMVSEPKRLGKRFNVFRDLFPIKKKKKTRKIKVGIGECSTADR